MDIQTLETVARQVRRDIITMTAAAGAGHPGGSLSSADVMVALYFDVMNVDPKDDKNPDRDRFVLSKGHSAPALYGTLCELGYFGREEFDHFRQLHGILQGHPDIKKCPGVDASTGSLGQGISIAVGMALGAKHTGNPCRVYALLGDGESQEGLVWEASMAAAHYKLDNLTVILIGCYVIGYLMQLINASFIDFLTLDAYMIFTKGQVWRIFTWIISPPADLGVFTIVMLFFYYSIGTTLERTWGTYRYNVYIWGGVLITLLASFVCMGVCYLIFGSEMLEVYGAIYKSAYSDVYGSFYSSMSNTEAFFAASSFLFSTYYINMSIFLAYAATYPDNVVLLMFVVPVKVKWLGFIYGALLIYQMIQYYRYAPLGWFGMVAIAASLLNFLIFWLRSRNLSYLSPKQVKRKVVFKQQVKSGEKYSGHKCCICGRTDADDPTLEFRYCSKCAGNYEYCQDHLFTHEHKV